MAGLIKADTIYGESSLKFNIGETTYITVSGTSWNVAQPMNVQNDMIVTGNLTVTGLQTLINTSVIAVDDKNILLADTTSPTDALADGGGITLKGSTDKNFTWSNTTKCWTLDQGINVQQILENANVTATALTGTQNINILEKGVNYYTANCAANWTMNIRANSSTMLDAVLSTGQSVTVAYLATQLSSNTYYQSAFTIDGNSVTPKWQGGTAPSAGNASSIDVYSFTILKTAANTYTVLGSQTQYA